MVSDPSHALKAIRNALQNHKILYLDDKYVQELGLSTNEINFDIFEKIVDFCLERELTIAPHLNEKILKMSKGHFKKMDVGIAQKLLSWDTASSLQYLMTHYSDRFPHYYYTTKIFIEHIARWWDIVKSRTVSFCFHSDHTQVHTEHHRIWNENYEFLDKFIDFIASVKRFPDEKAFIDWHKAAIMGTRSILWLADNLVDKYGYKFFLPGRVLNDSIENFFSQIRGFNKNPSALMFKRFAKALAVTQYLKYSPKGNYGEDDSEHFFIDLDDFYNNEIVKDHEEEEYDVNEIESEGEFVLEKEDYDTNDFAEDCALANLSGYVLNKTVGHGRSKCKTCAQAFLVSEDSDDQEVNALIKAKSIKKGKLGFPSVIANKMFKSAELLFRMKRTGLLKKNKNVGQVILDYVLEDLASNFEDIPKCHLKIIFGRFIRIRCHFWAKRSNQELRTAEEEEIEEHANSSASLKQVQVTHN